MKNPKLFDDINPQDYNTVRKANYKACKFYYDDMSKIQWTVAAAATEAWGRKIFPELSGKQAEEKLWHSIFFYV